MDSNSIANTGIHPTPARSSLEPATLPTASVLLVDDQPARLLTYEAILAGLNVRCIRALSGEEALRQLLKEEFAAIIMDVSMPGMDGFETAHAIRQRPRFEHTPIIFVTGIHISELDQLRGYAVGAIDYISVPVVPEILRSKVVLLVELFSRRNELSRLNQELQATRDRLEAERNEAILRSSQLLSERQTATASGPRSKADLPLASGPEFGKVTDAEWMAAVLNSMTDEVYFTDLEGRYTYANAAALYEFGHASIAGLSVEQVAGAHEVYRANGTRRPIEEAPPLRAMKGEVIRDEEELVRIPRTGELRHRQGSAAPVRDGQGKIIGVVSVVRDITAQKRVEGELRTREVRSAALLQLAERFRSLSVPGDLAHAAAEVLGETLGVSRCGYGTVELHAETITIERDWNAPGSRSIAGTLHFRDYGTYIDELKRGETVVCENVELDPRMRGTLHELDVRSFINVPIMEQGHFVAVLFLTNRYPRGWSAEELAFVRAVADNTRIAVERRRSEQAVAADLRDTQLLRDLAARLIVEGDTAVLFDAVLETAISITGSDGGTMQLLDETRGELEFVATRGLEESLISHFARVDSKSRSSCGQALASGVRMLIDFDVPEVQDPDGSLRLHFAHGLRCAQSTPLVSRSGRVLGMFSTHWRTLRTLSSREQRFLDLLARQAADLIERTRTEQSLRASEFELRVAAERKDKFLATLAHELRNPLAAVSAASHLLLKSETKPEVATLARDGLQRQVRHMARLLDDLLDISRLTHGRVQLRLERVVLDDVIRDALATVQPQFESKQHRLDVQFTANTVHVHGDAVRLMQVLVNLLHNSAKYTPANGNIRLRVASNGPSVIITVSDDGMGIPHHLLPHIFEMFSDANVRQESGGLGVGLALVKGLVELHGGRVEARSAGEGLGSEFTVTLPALMSSSDEPSKSNDTAVVAPAMPRRILVTDDNADNAVSWSALLEAQGHIVRTAFDGRAALAEAERFKPEVVLLDIGMPHMNGYELARQIRATDWGKRTVLVAITGWGQVRDQEQARAAGCDHHLTKPARLEDVETILRRFNSHS